MRRALRTAAALLLCFEALGTALRLARLASTLVVHGPVALVLIALRALVAALQFTGGWLVLGGRLPGPAIARSAFLASAALNTLELGFRLAPSSIDPSLRWWFVAAYWVYAIAGAAALGDVSLFHRSRPERDR